MSITAVIGGQWGDEGKGKIVDLLSQDANMVARFQGGANAGHTIYKGDIKIVLHQVPSGILTENCQCVLGNGMVIDPVDLVQELNMLTENKIYYNGFIHIATNAHIVTPIHKWIDSKSEERSGQKIGTTCRGIGPAYVDKYNRCGIRALDMIDLEKLRNKVMYRLKIAINSGELSKYNRKDIMPEIDQFIEDSAIIAHMVEDTFNMLHEMVDSNQNILLEGAQGTMLDVNHGTYPFVTSSSPSTGGIGTGLGLPLTKVNRIIGIFKAYTTRVGKGPFPTELFDDENRKFQELGHEYGATTGRPRRCGWFDAVEASYSVQINGFTEITLTKLDILDYFEEIKVCIGYEYNGERTKRMSKWISDLSDVKPIYKTFEGWNQPTKGNDSYEKLPDRARQYIEFISDFIGVPVKILSIGPGRNEIIHIN
jgi:adenylosuccinate synthase